MNKKEIIRKLNNTQLTSHERESLLQLLHYLTVEGLSHSQGTHTDGSRTKSTRTKTKNQSAKTRTQLPLHQRKQHNTTRNQN